MLNQAAPGIIVGVSHDGSLGTFNESSARPAAAAPHVDAVSAARARRSLPRSGDACVGLVCFQPSEPPVEGLPERCAIAALRSCPRPDAHHARAIAGRSRLSVRRTPSDRTRG